MAIRVTVSAMNHYAARSRATSWSWTLAFAAAVFTTLCAGCLAIAAKHTEAPSAEATGAPAPSGKASRAGRASGSATATDVLPTVADKTARLERKAGLLTLYLDRAKGKVWLEVPQPGVRGVAGRYLYVDALVAGLGSNPVGLDRGQLGDSRVVAIRRVGPRVLVEQENLRYRALEAPAAESEAVRESFASSVLWGGDVAALDTDGRALVDFTSFVVRDAHGVAASLKASGQGSFSLDAGRSAVELDAVRALPDNVELEASLTFAGQDPGPLVRETAPSPESVTLIQHHSLVRLPDDGYRPRTYDPRGGIFAIGFSDYAAPLTARLDVHWLQRFRLEKTDPSAARSRVKKPIVYYVDPGAPDPVRQALIDGASWWAQAFDAAGFIDAFKVELLPPDVDPLDVRYNVIEWIHRSTRGWSYGSGIVDPRTGEMINGHVSLDSLRVRQDRLILEGLAGVGDLGSGKPDDPVVLALSRIRQLAAHEVGHTLGLAHNFAASTTGRASVMDYPAPEVLIRPDGTLDFGELYAKQIGAWDFLAVRYAYSEFPAGTDERSALDAILADGARSGLVFLSDGDARPAGAADPRASLWDSGPDAAASLTHEMRVRDIALRRFGKRNLAPGSPLALLEDVLAPLYFHHRYQLQAATKTVGGIHYDYSVLGSGETPARPLAAAAQRRALAAVTATLAPSELDLPDSVLELLLPRPPEYDDRRETFSGSALPAFDALGAAATAADLAVRGLLVPERAARLVDQNRRNSSLPGLEEVEEALVKAAFPGGATVGEGAGAGESPRLAEVRRVVQQIVVRGLIDLASNDRAPLAVRARTEARLEKLRADLRRPSGPGRAGGQGAGDAQRAYLDGEITRWLARTREAPVPVAPAPPPPPGDPIGCSLDTGS